MHFISSFTIVFSFHLQEISDEVRREGLIRSHFTCRIAELNAQVSTYNTFHCLFFLRIHIMHVYAVAYIKFVTEKV